MDLGEVFAAYRHDVAAGERKRGKAAGKRSGNRRSFHDCLLRLAGTGGSGDGDDAKGGSADRLPIGYQWLKAGLLEGAGVELEAALVAAERPLTLAALLPVTQHAAHGARQACPHAATRRQIPGAVGVIGQERAAIEREQPLGEPLQLRAVA